MVPPHGTVVYRVSASRPGLLHPAQTVTGVDVPSGVAGVPSMLTPAGHPSEVTATGTNHGRVPVRDARLTLTAPPGWAVRPVRVGSARLLGTDRSVTGTWLVTPPAGTPAGELPLTATLWHTPLGFPRRGTPVTAGVHVPAAAPTGVVDLGDHPWAAMTNGYGPAERDMSNGGPKPGDGKPMVVNGVPYAKGIGTHAPAQLVYYLDGRCTTLSVLVGIDDDRDDAHKVGSSTFEVWADRTKTADSGVRTWADPAVPLTADVTGARYLRLVQTVGPDTNSYDRGDWAAPRLTCRP
jgi:alpha-galactosidase